MLTVNQGVSRRCRLSWLTNSAIVYESKWGGGGWSQPMSTAVHMWHGAQINFGDLTPYLTYAVNLSKALYKQYFWPLQKLTESHIGNWKQLQNSPLDFTDSSVQVRTGLILLRRYKETTFFLTYKKIQMGSGTKSYMAKGFLIWGKTNIFTIYDEAVSHTHICMTLHPIPLNFLIFEENFLFFFYRCISFAATGMWELCGRPVRILRNRWASWIQNITSN